MVRLFTWTRGRGGSSADRAPVVSFQGTVLTHAGARPGKLPPADIVARVSFDERSCGSCRSLAAASSAGATAPGSAGGCASGYASGCAHAGAPPRGCTVAGVPTVGARNASVELSRCTDEVTESVFAGPRHSGVGSVGFGSSFVGSGAGSAIGSGASSVGRTLSSNGSHTLSTSTASGVRAVGSSAPQPLTTRAFVDIISSASVSCATITSTAAPNSGGAPSSSGSVASARLSNWEPLKRSLVVSHSAVDWRTPSLVSPALRALLSPLVDAPEVDRLLNEAASLFRTQQGRRPGGSDVLLAGTHDRPPRWEVGATAPARPHYSSRAPASRSLDGAAAPDGLAASGVPREAPPLPQGPTSGGAPPPLQQGPVSYPPYGHPRSAEPNSGTTHAQQLPGQGGCGPPWQDQAGAVPQGGVPASPGDGMPYHQRRPSSLPPLLPGLSPSGALDWRYSGAGTSPHAPSSGAHLAAGQAAASSGSIRRTGSGAPPGQVRATPSSTPPPHRASVPPGVQVAERPPSLSLSAMQQVSPYGHGSFGGVPSSPVVSGVSPMSLAGTGVPLRGHAAAGAAASPMSLSPMNPAAGGVSAVHGSDHRGPLPTDGTPYGSVYGPALGATAAASDFRNLSTAPAPQLPPSGKAGGFRMRPSVMSPCGTNSLSPPAFLLPRVWSSAANPAVSGPGATSGVAQGTLPSQGMLPMGVTESQAEGGSIIGAPLSGGHTGVPALAAPSAHGATFPEPPLPGHSGGAQAALASHSLARPLPPDEAEGLYPVAKRTRVGSPSTLAVPIPCGVCGRNFATRGDRNRYVSGCERCCWRVLLVHPGRLACWVRLLRLVWGGAAAPCVWWRRWIFLEDRAERFCVRVANHCLTSIRAWCSVHGDYHAALLHSNVSFSLEPETPLSSVQAPADGSRKGAATPMHSSGLYGRLFRVFPRPHPHADRPRTAARLCVRYLQHRPVHPVGVGQAQAQCPRRLRTLVAPCIAWPPLVSLDHCTLSLSGGPASAIALVSWLTLAHFHFLVALVSDPPSLVCFFFADLAAHMHVFLSLAHAPFSTRRLAHPAEAIPVHPVRAALLPAV